MGSGEGVSRRGAGASAAFDFSVGAPRDLVGERIGVVGGDPSPTSTTPSGLIVLQPAGPGLPTWAASAFNTPSIESRRR